MDYQLSGVEYNTEFGEIKFSGKTEKLSAKEMKVLNYFIENQNQLVTYDMLINDVWQRIVSENAVLQIITHIRQIFKKIGFEEDVIINFRGKGFQLNQELRVEKGNAATMSPKASAHKGKIYALLISLALIMAYMMFLHQNNSSIPSNRILFLHDLDTETSGHKLDAASQLFLQEILNISSNNDIVNTNNLSGLSEQKQFADQLWRMNANLNLVTTQLSQLDNLYVLTIDVTRGNQSTDKKTFSEPNLANVLIKVVDWISLQNSSLSVDNKLKALVPKDAYLIETYLRGMAAAKKGDNGSAIDYFNICLKQKNDFHLARFGLAKALRKHGKFDESSVQLNVIKKSNLINELASAVDNELGAISLIRGDLDKAKNIYSSIVSDYPLTSRTYSAYLNLATTYYRLGEYQLSLQQLSKLEEYLDENIQPEYAAILHFSKAGIYLNQKQMPDAIKHLNRSLALFTQLGDLQRQGLVYTRLVYYHVSMGQIKQAENYAIKELEIAQHLDNKRGIMTAMDTFANVKINQGYFSQAREYSNKLNDLAIELGTIPGQIHSAQWLALIALELDQLEQATIHINHHKQLAQKANAKSSIKTNHILQFKLALAENDLPKATSLLESLNQIDANDGLQTEIVIPMSEYIAKNKSISQAINYLVNKKENSNIHNDDGYLQLLDIQLAQYYLTTNTKLTINILSKIVPNEINTYPYFTIMAEALFLDQQYISAMTYIEKAKQSYNQRWNTQHQKLLQDIQSKIANTD